MYKAYHIKQQKPVVMLLLSATIIVSLILIAMGDKVGWMIIKYAMCLLLLVLTSNIFSDEVERKTDYLIFTSNTPKYKILIKKYISGLMLNLIITVILYIVAMLSELEMNMLGLISINMYAILISQIGLLVGNISNKTILAYGIPFAIWVTQIFTGMITNQKLYILSICINIELQFVLWKNIFIIFGLSILLMCINIWIVSKGEGIRKKLIVLTIAILFLYIMVTTLVYSSLLLENEFWNKPEHKISVNPNLDIYFKGISDDVELNILTYAEEITRNIDELIGKKVKYPDIKIYFDIMDRAEEGANQIELLKDFNPVEYGGKDFAKMIGYIILEDIFDSIEDINMRSGWIEYYYRVYVEPSIVTNLDKNVWTRDINYDIFQGNNRYLENLDKSLKLKNYTYYDLYDVSSGILYAFDKEDHEEFINLLRYIYSKDILKNEEIKGFLLSRYEDGLVEESLSKYELAKSKHDEYNYRRQIIKE